MRSGARRGFAAAGVVAVLALVAAACTPAPPPPPPPPPVSGLCNGTSAASSAAANTGTPTPQHPITYSAVVKTASGPQVHALTATSESARDAWAQQLQRDGQVTSVAPQTSVSSLEDPVTSPQSAQFYSAYQWNMTQADFPTAWQHFGGQGIRIAVIDTGARLTHNNLTGIVAGTDFCVDPNGNTAVSASLPGNGDPNGHGTHTAGIAGARNNGTEVVGGAPNSTIITVRVLDKNGNGTSSAVANGILWAATPTTQTFMGRQGGGAQVISMSLGGGADPAMLKAIEYAQSQNVVVAAAAGNDGRGDVIEYPGGYSTQASNVLAVAATGSDGTLASYSDYGTCPNVNGGTTQPDSCYVNVAAPGGGGQTNPFAVLSTYNGLRNGVPQPDSDVNWLEGTSMATPAAAAAAALLLDKCGVTTTPDKIATDIETHGSPVHNPNTGLNTPFNLMDVGAATNAACPT